MLSKWKESSTRIKPISYLKNHAARRRALSSRFPGEVLIVPTGHEVTRANDTTYRFRPGTDFFYLVGGWEPDAILVLAPNAGKGHRSILYVEPNPGRSDPTFFTDRAKGELWVGLRLGVPESQKRYGVDECRSLRDFPADLKALTSEAKASRCLRGISSSTEAVFDLTQGQALSPREKQASLDTELATALSEQRLIKDQDEVKELSRAVAITFRAFEDVIAKLKTAKSEREVEGIFALRARVEGNDVGYGTIAASGSHACTLHWTRNDGRLKRENLLLLDAGVEGEYLYTADVTRTIPIGGRFSTAQREIYELVLKAQVAALKEVRPGKDFLDPNRAAMKVLAKGLEELGVLTCSAEEALKDENQFYKRYSLHNVSHMLGMDVHDCAKARLENYKYGKLKAGMVLTIEPGLYFQTDDLTVPRKYRGIGVRIEDDVLVTKTGCRNLTAKFPKSTKDIEGWCSSIWKRSK